MGLWDLKFWTYFDARYKKAVWIILIVLIQIAIGLTAPRLFLKGPKTRATFMSLGMVRSSYSHAFLSDADSLSTGRQISRIPCI